MADADPNIVRFVVSGHSFVTQMHTLRTVPGSFFDRLAEEKTCNNNEDTETVSLTRCPHLFSCMLSFLRMGNSPRFSALLPYTEKEIEAWIEEAKFYCLSPLYDLICRRTKRKAPLFQRTWSGAIFSTVHFAVRGEHIECPALTLLNCHGSLLEEIYHERTRTKDIRWVQFDRSPVLFRRIIEFLTNMHFLDPVTLDRRPLILEYDESALQEFLEEAEFFRIAPLCDLIRYKLARPPKSLYNGDTVKFKVTSVPAFLACLGDAGPTEDKAFFLQRDTPRCSSCGYRATTRAAGRTIRVQQVNRARLGEKLAAGAAGGWFTVREDHRECVTVEWEGGGMHVPARLLHQPKWDRE